MSEIEGRKKKSCKKAMSHQFVSSGPDISSNQESAMYPDPITSNGPSNIPDHDSAPSPPNDKSLEQNNLEEFTCFPKLPPELRLLIWRATFPKARSVLMAEPRVPCFPSRKLQSTFVSDANESPLPIALNIDHESRVETLTHYHILPRTSASGLKLIPFAFDPVVDDAVLDFPEAFNPTRSLVFKKTFWPALLPPHLAMKCVAQITHLTVSNCFICSVVVRDIQISHRRDAPGAHGDRPYCCVFRHLPALELVTLVSEKRINYNLYTQAHRDQFEEFIGCVLRQHEGVFLSGHVPKLHVMQRKREFLLRR